MLIKLISVLTFSTILLLGTRQLAATRGFTPCPPYICSEIVCDTESSTYMGTCEAPEGTRHLYWVGDPLCYLVFCYDN